MLERRVELGPPGRIGCGRCEPDLRAQGGRHAGGADDRGQEPTFLVRPEAAAARIGFGVLSSGRDGAADAPFTVLLAGPRRLTPHPPTEVTVHALVGDRLVTSKATLPSDGTGLAMRFAAGAFAAPEPRKDVARPAGE
jgi:hypothetical protein